MNTTRSNSTEKSEMIADTPYPSVHGIEAQLIACVKALVHISSIISRKTLSDYPYHRDTQQTGHSRALPMSSTIEMSDKLGTS
jgi:hypothetical protein